MLQNGQVHEQWNNFYSSMCFYCNVRKVKRYKTHKVACLNFYCILIVTSLSIRSVNSNTTNMRHFSEGNAKFKIKSDLIGAKSDILGVKSDSKFSDHELQNDNPSDDNYEDHDTDDYTKVNFEKPYYNSEDFLHLNIEFYSGDNAYSNYEVYKKYYLNPSDPLPKSSVKFKISSRIVQTKYGKLQGFVLAMDEHRYLSPLEVFLGVPYATPPVGSNR